ncbi:unnamed protein product [Ilex paraguariensis]|uniref:Uncharacterized protein n=1 Tax=Ilex paraguariensis TaxID=185542 RepID=A0ABC8TU88_9AQUA
MEYSQQPISLSSRMSSVVIALLDDRGGSGPVSSLVLSMAIQISVAEVSSSLHIFMTGYSSSH